MAGSLADCRVLMPDKQIEYWDRVLGSRTGDERVITIQTAMLVALGFLLASLLALVIAPAFWSRAVRLTTQRLKASMPISEVEIRADKDRIRAEYAIKVHKLESHMEHVRLAAARQQIEINRRDAAVNEAERALDALRGQHEEALNARRVLQQTVADRLPQVENRLNDARKLLYLRDRELAELARTAELQGRTLSEAAAINTQQQVEIERLAASVTSRATRNQEGLSDPRFEREVALKAEIESLRSKTRDQAELLKRIQGAAIRAPDAVPARSSVALPQQGAATPLASAKPAVLMGDNSAAIGLSSLMTDGADQADAEQQIRVLRARTEDQSGEIIGLKAALEAFENQEEDADDGFSLRQSRIALKARVQSLEAHNVQQAELVQKLRSELAASNDRIGRQASHFTTELKRLGAGSLPPAASARRGLGAATPSLADRVAQARNPSPGTRAQAASSNAASEGPATVGDGAGGSKRTAAPEVNPENAAQPLRPLRGSGQTASTSPSGSETPGDPAANADEDKRRSRLLERIANIGRSS